MVKTIIEPYYKDDYVTLFLGDCNKLCWDLPKECVDAVFTDPPYDITSGEMPWDGGRTYTTKIQDNDFADSFDFHLLNLMNDYLLKRTNMIFFCNKHQFMDYLKWVRENKTNFQLLEWHKPDSIPHAGLWLLDTEYIFHIFKNLGHLKNKHAIKTYYIHNVVRSEYEHPCLHPDSLVLTDCELKPIKDIDIEEKVLSEDGNYHSVISKTNHAYNEQLYEIETIGTNLSVLATHNHPFLIYRPMRRGTRIVGCVIKYINADSIKVGDYTMTPILSSQENQVNDNYRDDFWFTAGLWLAEGSLQKAGHGFNKYPVFALNSNETNLVEIIKSQTNKKVGVYNSKDSKGMNVVVFDPHLAIQYKRLFSTGAKTKKLSQKIFALDDKMREELLNGYLAGDGSTIRGNLTAKTVSRTLAFQLKLLGESVGYQTDVYEFNETRKVYIKERQITQGTYYQIYFYDRTRNGKIDKRGRLSEVIHNNKRFRLNYVKNIYVVPYTGEVINLTIQDSPTFMTVIGISHNTVKPEKIITELILHLTNKEDTILDPFCGTGTTNACAKRLGRKSIGIEIHEKYIEMAANRCRHTEANSWQSSWME